MPAPQPFSLSPSTVKPPTGKTVLITGGVSGIGHATAKLLLEHHNNVAVLDRASAPASLSSIAPSRFLFVHCDVTSWASQRSAFASVLARFGRLDAVFINAGVAEYGNQIFADAYEPDGALAEPDRRTIDVDIRSVSDSIKLAVHHMRNDYTADAPKGSGKGAGGSIVMTASLAGYLASAGAPLYSAAKHGVVGYLRALKGDCAKVGLAMSVIAPGIVLTPIVLGRKEGQSLEEWGEEMRGLGVPINDAETVGLTVAHLMGMGKDANGMGILIQGNRMQDLEAGIAKSRGEWMGEEMLKLFRGGRNAPLFPNKL